MPEPLEARPYYAVSEPRPDVAARSSEVEALRLHEWDWHGRTQRAVVGVRTANIAFYYRKSDTETVRRVVGLANAALHAAGTPPTGWDSSYAMQHSLGAQPGPRETGLREALQAKRGYPVTEGDLDTRWQPDAHGAYVGFEDAWDIVLAALSDTAETGGEGR